jgi:hypothetical protein
VKGSASLGGLRTHRSMAFDRERNCSRGYSPVELRSRAGIGLGHGRSAGASFRPGAARIALWTRLFSLHANP